jgi:hypothetical protein
MALLQFLVCLMVSAAVDDRVHVAHVADMDRDIAAFSARIRAAATEGAKANAILDLCQLHNQIWIDPRYAKIDKLRGMRSKAVFILKSAQKELRQSAAKSAAPVAADGGEGQASQRGALSRDASDGGMEPPWLDSLLVGLQYAPGPGQLSVHAGSFAGDDHGPELVALIEATIHPEQWDTNGGPGHIHYYRPVMAMVVTAGSLQHEEVSGLLQGLRDSGN